MPYIPQTWANGAGGATPLSAARLNYIEAGIQAAMDEAESAGGGASTVPTITSVTPASGPPAAGTRVSIAGTGFAGVEVVRFNGVLASEVVVHSDSLVSCLTPALGSGAGTVEVASITGSDSATYTVSGATAAPYKAVLSAIRWPGNNPHSMTQPATTKTVDGLTYGPYVEENWENADARGDYDYLAPTRGWNNAGVPNTSEIMQRDILDAAAHGVDAFMYCSYPPTNYTALPDFPERTIHEVYAAHRAAPNKALVKHWLMLMSWWVSKAKGATSGVTYWRNTYVPYIVASMQDPDYLRVTIAGVSRPVLGWWESSSLEGGGRGFGSVGAAQAEIAFLRAAIATAGLPVAYEIDMQFNQTMATQYGFHAISWYGPNAGNPAGSGHLAWSGVRTKTIANLATSTGSLHLVPCAYLGADARVRAANGGAGPIGFWTDPPTFEQARDLVRTDTIAWSAANPSKNPSKIVSAYSWDEVEEGYPPLLPSVQDGARLLEAVRVARTVDPASWEDVVNCDDLRITYAGGTWTRAFPVPGGLRSNDEMTTVTTNATATLAWGRALRFRVRARMGPDRGIAAISVNGTLVANADLYSPSWRVETVYESPSDLTGATPTVQVKCTGTANPASLGVKVGVDCLEMVTSATAGAGPFDPAADLPSLWEMWEASDLTGLADGDPVSTFTAKVNGHNGVAAGTARATYQTNEVNGHPALLFDGVNDEFVTAAAAAPAGTLGMFFVIKLTDLTVYHGLLSKETPSDKANAFDSFIFQTSGKVAYRFNDGGGGTSGGHDTTGSAGLSTSAFALLVMTTVGSTHVVEVDGTNIPVTPLGAFPAAADDPTRGVTIGGRADGVTHFKGLIAACGLWVPGAGVSADRAGLHEWAQTRYLTP